MVAASGHVFNMVKGIILLIWMIATLHIGCFDEQVSKPCLCVEEHCLEVYCSINQETDMRKVRTVLQNKTMKDLQMIAFKFASPSSVPGDLLSGIRARQIHLYGPINDPFPVALLDADVFRSSESFTEELFIYDSDLIGTNWTFLENFTRLEKIFLRTSSIKNFSSLPHLPTLEHLYLDSVSQLEDIAWPALNTSSLTSITITNGDSLNKEVVNNIVDDFPQNVLHVQFTSSRLTQVPRKIRRLNQLKSLDLSNNVIRRISVESLPTFLQPEFIDFRSNQIQSIDKGAFRGNISSTGIDLSYNNLNKLDRAVFFPVLNSMINGTGFVYLYKNPLACDCDLAWLMRDNRHLLKSAWNAFCSNGTSLTNLDKHGFDECP